MPKLHHRKVMGVKPIASPAGKPLMGYEEIVIQEDSSKCCSCTPSWVKTFLIFFTAIILLIALALIGLGIFLLSIRLPFVPMLLGEVAYLSHFLMFVVGGLLVVVCIIGFIGVSNGNSTLLLTFAWMLFVILLIQFTTGILALCFSNVLTEWLADRLMFTMQTLYFHGTDGIDAAVDQIQQKFKCCGSRSYRDWTDSVFGNNSKLNEVFPFPEYSLVVPDSCCIRSIRSCGTHPHPSNVFYEGCMESILLNLREQYYIICVVALALVFVEFFGVILACCYSKAPKMNR
ncbi:CD151 antigen [Schistosoma japonicum]|nr:CD151 antigen [Schistosoma japonicum]